MLFRVHHLLSIPLSDIPLCPGIYNTVIGHIVGQWHKSVIKTILIAVVQIMLTNAKYWKSLKLKFSIIRTRKMCCNFEAR